MAIISSKTLLRTCLLLSVAFVLASAQTCSKSKKCGTHACCSQWGNCGYGPDFCGKGCQNDCDAKPECGKYALDFDCPLKVCCSKWGFCGTTEAFCNSECQGNCQDPPPPSCSGSQGPQLNIGYYASWAATRKCNQYAVENIDAKNYTHLNYAFVDIKDGIIPPQSAKEDANLRAFANLKRVNPSLKVLASVGGWAFNDPGPTQQEFHNIALTRQSRQKFISSVRDFLQTYNFDGIDVDWEYPAADDRGGSPEDKDNYLLLLQEMRKAFGSRYLVTIAAPASYWYLRHFRIGEMSKVLDWINVMTYDIHGVWDADIESLGPYVKSHTDIREVEDGIKLYRKDGVPDDKLVLGLGFYGRAFTLKTASCKAINKCEFSGAAMGGECTDAPGTLGWFEIEKIIKEQGVQPIFDRESVSKVLVFNDDQWVAYDDEETLAIKRNWARKSCMKGTMIWSIDQGLEKRGGSGIYTDNYVDKSGSITNMYKPVKNGQYAKPGPNRIAE